MDLRLLVFRDPQALPRDWGMKWGQDGNGYIHPTPVGSLSFREGARVQSFHDGYLFCASPSDQVRQPAVRNTFSRW